MIYLASVQRLATDVVVLGALLASLINFVKGTFCTLLGCHAI